MVSAVLPRVVAERRPLQPCPAPDALVRILGTFHAQELLRGGGPRRVPERLPLES